MIGELLPLVMADIGAIDKTRTNQHQKYLFRGIDDVLNAVSPVCAKRSVRVEVTIHDYQSEKTTWIETYQTGDREKFRMRVTLKMRLAFTAPDGSQHIAEAIGEAMDTNGDKATNKAMSAAFKYACFMGLVIPVEGVLDESEKGARRESESSHRNMDCQKWQDWKTSKGMTLGEWVKSDMSMTEKEDGMQKLKDAIEVAIQKASPIVAKSYMRDLAFVDKAIDEMQFFTEGEAGSDAKEDDVPL